MLRAIDVGIGDNADGHAGNSNAHYCKAEASDAALSAFFYRLFALSDRRFGCPMFTCGGGGGWRLLADWFCVCSRCCVILRANSA